MIDLTQFKGKSVDETTGTTIAKAAREPRLYQQLGKIRQGATLWSPGHKTHTKVDAWKVRDHKLIVNNREVWDFGAIVYVR
jgi:hypothetical protein